MVSVQHCQPSPSPQSCADKLGEDALSVDLLWTDEELDINLETVDDPKSKQQVIDEVLKNIEKLDELWEINEDADVLCHSQWMNEDLQSFNHFSQTQNINAIDPNALCGTFNNGAFTPPQTPPYEEHQHPVPPMALPSYPVAVNVAAVGNTQQQDLNYTISCMVEMPEFSGATQQTDVARELAYVEELVRKRADCIVPPSPCPSTNSSSAGCASSDSSSEDNEWSPSVKSSQKAGRRRPKPYSNNDDKRSRKKEQNKNAATRYRMKKKAEVLEILSEEQTLEKERNGLESKVVDLQREIKVMKGLMRDFFKEKGLLSL